MRKPLPPIPVLSGNGQTAVVKYNYELSLWDMAEGAGLALPLAHEAKVWAMAPRAPLLAVAGEERLSLFRAGELLNTVESRRLYRLAVGDAGQVAGLTHPERGDNTLYIWPDGQLEQPPLVESLEPLLPEALQLDAERRRVALWGKTGAGLMGQLFVRVLSFEDDQITTAWSGEKLPVDQPERILFPLVGGDLGLYDHKQLVTVEPTTGQPGQRYPVKEAMSLALSPNGEYLAWLQEKWAADTMKPTGYVRLAHLPQNNISEPIILERLSQFSALAVDDAGQIRFVFGEKPNRLVAFSLRPNQSPDLLFETTV